MRCRLLPGLRFVILKNTKREEIGHLWVLPELERVRYAHRAASPAQGAKLPAHGAPGPGAPAPGRLGEHPGGLRHLAVPPPPPPSPLGPRGAPVSQPVSVRAPLPKGKELAWPPPQLRAAARRNRSGAGARQGSTRPPPRGSRARRPPSWGTAPALRGRPACSGCASGAPGARARGCICEIDFVFQGKKKKKAIQEHRFSIFLFFFFPL